MNGKFSERTTPLMISAMRSACSSLSITQGPAMRNRSPVPTRTLSIWKDRVKVVYRRDAEGAEKTKKRISRRSLRLGGELSSSHFFRPQKHLIHRGIFLHFLFL